MMKPKITDKMFQDFAQQISGYMFTQCSSEELTNFFETKEEDLIKYHHTFGRYIRNHFLLWKYDWDPEIKRISGTLVDCSPNHPDNLSQRLIHYVWTVDYGKHKYMKKD